MINFGLSAVDRRALQAALLDTHRVRVRVEVQTLEGEARADLTSHLLDGQVDVDATQPITRTATLVFTDRRRSLPFDTDSPATSALFLDRMIHVVYEVLVNGDWLPIPVFTGPIAGPTALRRDGDQVTVACQGKDALAMAACWQPLTLRKGTKKTDAIRAILAERAGETRFDIPDLPARLPHHLSLTRESIPWHDARKLGSSMDQQLFYDGRGESRLRHRPQHVSYEFTGTGSVVTAPQITYSGDVINTVEVLGAIPKGSKTHVRAVAVAPADHPLSPQRLGRNGVPRHLLPNGQITRNDKIKTTAEAQRHADTLLADGLRQAVEVTFDAVPVPMLDPLDLCHVHTDDGAVTFRLSKFSLPLVVGDPMSVGANRRRSLRKVRGHRYDRTGPTPPRKSR